MILHTESYEHLGDVQVWVQDMHLVWEKKRSAVTAAFPHERTLKRFEVEIDMPRERVWDYLIQPEFRNSLIGSDRMEIANRANGRIAPGSIYQCYHGDRLVPQTILEWEPFESMLVKEIVPLYPDTSVITEYRLESTERGTRLKRTISKATGPLIGRALVRIGMPIFGRMTQQSNEAFVSQIEKDYQAHSELLGSELPSALGSGAEFSEKQIREAAAAGLQASSASQKA